MKHRNTKEALKTSKGKVCFDANTKSLKSRIQRRATTKMEKRLKR